MTWIRESVEIAASPNAVWELIGDPGEIGEWVPALAGSSATAEGRACTTADGFEIRERLLEHSDDDRFYTYSIEDSPFPLRSYVSRLSVHEQGHASRVDWVAEFEPESPELEGELEAGFGQLYREALASLRERLEAPVARADSGARG